jgi:hypothetical protein
MLSDERWAARRGLLLTVTQVQAVCPFRVGNFRVFVRVTALQEWLNAAFERLDRCDQSVHLIHLDDA